ncbi:MAG: hypothetical protein ACFE8J_01845 [Candidatus Heimdallarchaeota archaeon]
MYNFFKVYTYTPWDGLNSNTLIDVNLLSLKSIFENYPVIEKEFFDDLSSNLTNHKHYSCFETIRRVTGPENEDYDIKDWRFIWAYDNKDRIYQFLLQSLGSNINTSQSVLVALAPPELAKLFLDYKKTAIHKIFSLLNKPSEIKFLIYLIPKGKSIAEQFDTLKWDKTKIQQLKYIQNLANKPNIKGQWFPSYEIRCPKCDEFIAEILNYKIGYGKIKCPKCGYEITKNV